MGVLLVNGAKPLAARQRVALVVFVFFSWGLFSTAEAANRAAASPDRNAVTTVSDTSFTLANSLISLSWEISGGSFRPVRLGGESSESQFVLSDDAFAVTVGGNEPFRSSHMRIVRGPVKEGIAPIPKAQRAASRASGKQIVIDLEDQEKQLHAVWRAILLDGSNYIRQQLTLTASKTDLPITSVRLVDVNAPGATVSGTVRGSPIVAGNFFMMFENPLSESKVRGDRAIAQIVRELPLKAGQSVTYSYAVGVAPKGQLRRGFLEYIERERAHPYRPFLHYNSWYDIGYFSPYDESASLQVVEAFGNELVRKRHVQLDSFLFDDGWDNPATLWQFNAGFPEGFSKVEKTAEQYGSSPGVWLSPWGGYGKPQQERLKFGKQQGYETSAQGFVLSGPKYYERFRDACLEMIRKYGVNQFKIDGTGNADSVFPGSRFDSDFAAAISLIGELRSAKPGLYVNLTTGTYPSPAWLLYADSIWRGGEDHDFAGVGSDRQKWITYRDADTYQGVVMAGPLFPINSLMLHGLIYAKHARHLDTDPSNDFADEIHSYFGTGTQLQEMYITPSLLSPANWDAIAEAAKWSRENADVLVDTHWIGGDPALLEPYGWAAWNTRKGILTLRNPSNEARDFSIDARSAFELPAGAAASYEARSPWQTDAGKPAIELHAGQPYVFHLKPFQVVNLDVLPRR